MSDEVMTNDDLLALQNMPPAAVKVVVKKLSTNPLFLEMIGKLIDAKLYTGLNTNPHFTKDYGGKSPTDILVDSIASTLYNSTKDETQLDGASYIGLDASANLALSNATNVHDAIIAIANAVTALGGQIIVPTPT